MELSENERLILLGKKDEIFKITSEILKSYNPGEKNTNIKINLNKILSILTSMAGYAKPDRDLNAFTKFVIHLTMNLDIPGYDTSRSLEAFCTIVNSIKFDFTRKQMNIHIPVHFEAMINKNQFG